MLSLYSTSCYNTDLDKILSCWGCQIILTMEFTKEFHGILYRRSYMIAHVLLNLLNNRAATFTRVNGTVSCFCNKRLQN